MIGLNYYSKRIWSNEAAFSILRIYEKDLNEIELRKPNNWLSFTLVFSRVLTQLVALLYLIKFAKC